MLPSCPPRVKSTKIHFIQGAQNVIFCASFPEGMQQQSKGESRDLWSNLEQNSWRRESSEQEREGQELYSTQEAWGLTQFKGQRGQMAPEENETVNCWYIFRIGCTCVNSHMRAHTPLTYIHTYISEEICRSIMKLWNE